MQTDGQRRVRRITCRRGFQSEMRTATDPSRVLLTSSRPPPLQRLKFWWRTKLAHEQDQQLAGVELLPGLDIACR